MKSSGVGKTTIKTARNGHPVGALITPPHGRGKLRNGGTNKGGPGRPPSEIRRACRQAFDERIPILMAMADDEELEPAVRQKAIEMLGKYGLGSTITPTGAEGETLLTEFTLALGAGDDAS